MDATERSGGGFFRRLGRGIVAVFDAFDFLEGLVLVARIVIAPFRLLAKAADWFW